MENLDVEKVLCSERPAPSLHKVGFCIACNAIVPIDTDGRCASGHTSQSVHAVGEAPVDAEFPAMPRVNWGAFLMPSIWGPAHHIWASIFFYPIWLLADTSLRAAAGMGGWRGVLLAILVLGIMVAVEAWFAMTASGPAYARMAERYSLERYLERERIWAWAMLPIALVFIVLATYYNVAILGVLGV